MKQQSENATRLSYGGYALFADGRTDTRIRAGGRFKNLQGLYPEKRER